MRSDYDEYKFVATLEDMPDMSKYQMILPEEKDKYNLWNKPGGGSIFSNNKLYPIRDAALSNKNYTHQQYFKLYNLEVEARDDYAIFADIDLLAYNIDSNTANPMKGDTTPLFSLTQEELTLLEKINFESEMLETHPDHKFRKTNDIDLMVNGFARIVFYEVHSFNTKVKKYDPLHEPHMNKILAIEEGQMLQAHLYGFGRILDFSH